MSFLMKTLNFFVICGVIVLGVYLIKKLSIYIQSKISNKD